MSIKTIQINNNVPKLYALAKELYDHTLKDDPEFHFCFEPALIIRIKSKDCLTKAKSLLQSRSIEFEEYDYPNPYPPEGIFGDRYGEDGIVANNPELFLPVFHANSVAALTMSEKDHCKHLERLFHTVFIPKGYSHSKEG